MDIFLKILIEQYFIKPECLVLFSDITHEFRIPLDTVIFNIDITHTYKISDRLEEAHLFKNFGGCRNFIINVDNAKEVFENIEKYVQTFDGPLLDGRKYVIFANNNNNEDITKIFSSSAIKFVSNIIVVTTIISSHKNGTIPNFAMKGNNNNNNNNLLEIWTHKYSSGHNNGNDPFCTDKWFYQNKSFMNGKNLFYNKLENLQGRTVKVVTSPFPPHSRISNGEWTGTDINMIKLIIKSINGSMKIKYNKDFWGTVYPNGSSCGIKGDLYKDLVDIGTAGLDLNNYMNHKYFTVIPAFVFSDKIGLIPKSILLETWFFQYKIFSPRIWIYLFSSYTIIALILYISHYNQIYLNLNALIIRKKPTRLEIMYSEFSTIGKLILQQPNKKKYYFKALIILVMMITIIFSTAYNAGSASMLSVTIFEKPIDNREDFLMSDIPWAAARIPYWISTWANDNNEKYQRAEKRFVELRKPGKRQKKFSRENFMLMANKLADTICVDICINTSQLIQNYYIMKENLRYKANTLILRKHSIMLPIFIKISATIFESGIMNYWASQNVNKEECVFQQFIENLQTTSKMKTPKKLTVSKLFALFLILISGLIISLIIFVLEILIDKIRAKSRQKNF